MHIPSNATVLQRVCACSTIAASQRCTCSALENTASLPMSITYRLSYRCRDGIQRLGIIIMALQADVHFHSCLIHMSGIRCLRSLYRSRNIAVPLPIAICAYPSDIRMSFLVASSRSKWSSSTVYLCSFVLTAKSGSSIPPSRAGPNKHARATFRCTLCKWHVAIPSGCCMVINSFYLSVPPLKVNRFFPVMEFF